MSNSNSALAVQVATQSVKLGGPRDIGLLDSEIREV